MNLEGVLSGQINECQYVLKDNSGNQTLTEWKKGKDICYFGGYMHGNHIKMKSNGYGKNIVNVKGLLFFIFFITLIFFSSSNFFAEASENKSEANFMNNGGVAGVTYFSNGTDLIKYDFLRKNKEFLFKYGEKSGLGDRITHITYVAWLKSKKKILFVGSNTITSFIFEADLDLKNWKEYVNTQNIRDLALSPDENMIAYYKYPNNVVIRRYEDLEKAGFEQTIARNAFSAPLWISNFELVYNSADKNIVKINIKNGEQQILVNNLFVDSISPDKRHLLCSDRNSIFLYDIDSSQLKLLKRGDDLFQSSPSVWSPDGKHFLYSKFQHVKFTINVIKYMNGLTAEKKDVCMYSLTTGKDEILLENEKMPFGGFWRDGE
jgi:hypothetical protein